MLRRTGRRRRAVGEQFGRRLLDALDVLEDAPKVKAQRAVGVRHVVGLQRVHYCGVLFNQRGDRPGLQQAQAPCAVQVRLGRVDGCPRGLVACQPQEFAVEVLVQAEEFLNVAAGLGG